MDLFKNAEGPFRYYALQGIRMLIIDDDNGLCSSLRFFFEDHDCRVTTTGNAEEGLELYNKIRHDIVLVDLNMPGLGGHNFVAELARNYPNTPIIVISGTGIIKEAIRSINLGAWDFVSKPIMDFENLELSVLKALERSYLIQENNKYRNNLERMIEEKTLELKQKNNELEQIIVECQKAKEKAEKADQLKTEFLAQMSHEIRTPLFQITGYLDMAKSSIEKGDISDTFKSFEEVQDASNRIIRTIELILSMSELNSGFYKPKFEIYSLSTLVDGKIIDYLPKIRCKNLNLSFLNDCPDSNILMDKYSVEQILDNLLDNAVKFTADGSITVHMFCSGHKKFVAITDTGIGISEEYMKNLYKPFTQEEQGYKRSYEGNGLGLAIAKKYCELNKAELHIQSKKNSGTTVSIIFENPAQ